MRVVDLKEVSKLDFEIQQIHTKLNQLYDRRAALMAESTKKSSTSKNKNKAVKLSAIDFDSFDLSL